MGVRLVPLGNLADRFYRVVRQTAKELDKKANLELKGTRDGARPLGAGEDHRRPSSTCCATRSRHGIEMPAERARAGKPEIGEISIDAAQRGNEVVLTIADDGGGPQLPRASARRRSRRDCSRPTWSCPRRSSRSSSSMPGFSTAEEVTADRRAAASAWTW